MRASKNWDQFKQALSTWDSPAQNAVYGDVDGHIGYHATGHIPIRAVGDGSRLDLVVNTTVLVADIAHFPTVNAAFAEFFPHNPPARMTMQVPLPKGLLISIGCVAVVEEE